MLQPVSPSTQRLTEVKDGATELPKMAALVAAVPNIKTGTRSGSANNGNKTPLSPGPKESAALTPPIRLSAGVPNAMLKIRTGYEANGILHKKYQPQAKKIKINVILKLTSGQRALQKR